MMECPMLLRRDLLRQKSLHFFKTYVSENYNPVPKTFSLVEKEYSRLAAL